jgi:serine protease Do
VNWLWAATVLIGLCPAGVRAQSTYETIAAVRPKMVKIYGAGGIRNLYAYSTGFLVSPQGHIATVWSHVLDADAVTVILDDGRKFEGKLLGAEPQLDLAVLKIPGEDLPYFDLDAQAATAGSGTRVLAFSNMFKVATGDEPVSVLHGVVAAQTKLAARRGVFEIPYNGPVYVVDAITNNPGSGGGMLTTRDGRLLAMIGKEIRNSQSNTWINYAIPISELKTPIQEIMTGRFTTRPAEPTEDEPSKPKRYRPLDFGLVTVPDVVFRTPAFVDSVVPGSPAAKAGIRPDDLILFVNDELIQSCKSLSAELGKLEAGDTLRLVLRRNGALVSVELPVVKKAE